MGHLRNGYVPLCAVVKLVPIKEKKWIYVLFPEYNFEHFFQNQKIVAAALQVFTSQTILGSDNADSRIRYIIDHNSRFKQLQTL